MRKIWKQGLALLACGALLLGGCGGKESGENGEVTPPVSDRRCRTAGRFAGNSRAGQCFSGGRQSSIRNALRTL